MEKRILLLLAVLTLLCVTGCSRNTHGNNPTSVSAEPSSQSGAETVHAAAVGEFAARVTACFADIPAYAESDMTGFVLVNEFQGWPFLINTGDPEIALKLETGAVYVFSIAPYDVGEIPADRIGEEAAGLEEWAVKATITGWRPAEEDEYGVVSLTPTYALYPGD